MVERLEIFQSTTNDLIADVNWASPNLSDFAVTCLTMASDKSKKKHKKDKKEKKAKRAAKNRRQSKHVKSSDGMIG